MRYIQYFKENVNNIVIVHNTKNFQITKNGNVYEVLDKNKNKKYFLDFNRADFTDEDEDQIYLKDFFEDCLELFNFFGQIVSCRNVVKEESEWWLMIEDNNWFADFFKLDNRTRKDFPKKVLSGEGMDIFQYYPKDFDIDEDFELDKDNLILVKVILYLEKQNNEDYDYSVEDIEDYSDVVEIVKEYDISALKRILQVSICNAHESADADDAYDDLLNSAYNHFGLVNGTAKWVTVNGYKHQQLFIKFKSSESAYYAKFLIQNYDDSYSDDMIEYWTKDYYNGDRVVMQETFDNGLPDKIANYGNESITYEEIDFLENLYDELKKSNPEITDEEIFKEFDIHISAKKYNL